ncbi:FHA domain-containing protein [Intrasporangium sp. DVR]|uniref:FHA domain-containing protein n=1 Tax=Intrasporangium sp. DVR TaxID=3127867 RepID=UPI00313A51C2
MTVTCPNGHQSQADDYCDVCGSPIEAAGSGAEASSPGSPGSTGSYAAGPAPAAGPGPAPAEAPSSPAGDSLECPNCSAPNPASALFCEACGYDFTTGAMPRSSGLLDLAGAPTEEPAPTPSSVQSEPTPTPSSVQNVPAAERFDWLAEVWVDPDWYQTQEVDDPCPSPGLPIIVPIRSRSVLLGRVSQSRNTHPEIDLSSDPGVSRRHAQLTTDGTRWFVEDLGSSNGTFVGPASGPLPDDPIAVGPRTELDDDDRLYVGAWSRVVVRRATPEEVEAYGGPG